MDKGIEGVSWDPWGDERIWFAFEDGNIGEMHSSKGLGLTFDMKVSPKSVTSLSANLNYPGILASTSLDGNVRIFDLKERDEQNCPKKIYDKLTRGGKLYCGNFCEDSPSLFACGSNTGEVVLMDFANIASTKEFFGGGKNDVENKIVAE